MGINDFWAKVGTQGVWSTDKLRKLGNETGIMQQRSTISTPEEIKIGDVFSSIFGAHPALVISMDEKDVKAVIMSTNDASHNIYQIKHSRFFKGNYVTFTVVTSSIEIAKAKYLGSIDDKKDIIKIIKALRSRYKNILTLRHHKIPLQEKVVIDIDDIDNFD